MDRVTGSRRLRTPSRRMPGRFRAATLALVAAIPVVVAACGADRSPSPAPTPMPTPGGPRASASGQTSAPVRSEAPPSSAGSAGSFDSARVSVTLAPFVDGLDAPLAIVNAGDGSGRLFVAEQGGSVRVIRDGRLLDQPFLVIDHLSSGGERGLLGLAFSPDYSRDGRVFVDYTDPNGDTQVSSFVVSAGAPDRAAPTSELRIISVKQPYANHNGGALVFDQHGYLLVALGDGGSGGDPQGNGQSLDTLLGKILRIGVSASSADHPYAIPSDNPYAGGGGRPEIWLTGLRNPWRMSLDRATRDLWIGDVGQGAWEEIDVQRAGAAGGTNFGWNRMEGSHCFQPATGCEDRTLTGPVTDYGHDQGCTVIGGYVYRGAAQPALGGGYLFGDYCSGRLWAIDPALDGYRSPVVVGESGRSISSFGEDEAGELYVADIGGGAILRVTASGR